MRLAARAHSALQSLLVAWLWNARLQQRVVRLPHRGRGLLPGPPVDQNVLHREPAGVLMGEREEGRTLTQGRSKGRDVEAAAVSAAPRPRGVPHSDELYFHMSQFCTLCPGTDDLQGRAHTVGALTLTRCTQENSNAGIAATEGWTFVVRAREARPDTCC